MRTSHVSLTIASAWILMAACGGAPEAAVPADDAAQDEGAAAGEPARGQSATTQSAEFAVAPPDQAAPPVVDPTLSPERQVAAKLGAGAQFLVGLGNDAADASDVNRMHAYELPEKVDIHYMYLSGLGWPSWKPNGSYVTEHAAAAKARGIVPMFTLYQAATRGDGNIAQINQASVMKAYWSNVRLMFERLGEHASPAIVHLEPDLWGYAQKAGGDDPAAVPMRVTAHVPECADLPDDISGGAKCMIRLARQLAPNVVVGLSASTFGATDGAGGTDAARVAAYLVALGAADADIVVLETLDRDAGCFERGADPLCKRGGKHYWDETNTASPSFHDHLAWARTIREGTGKPLLWWQMPLGRPSASPGGSAGRYRDNRVKYLFEHPQEFAAAGGIGAVFGTGAPNQTTVKTDGGQFAGALSGYRTAPAALP